MTKTKAFIKSVCFSFRLIYRSSGLLILLFLLLSVLGATISLLNMFLLKLLVDNLLNEIFVANIIWLIVLTYILLLVFAHFNNSVQNILYDSILKRAEHLYDCDLSNMLSKLPLAVVDSSSGKNMIDDVRRAKSVVIYTPFQLVQIISLAYTFLVSYLALAKFNTWFSFVFLALTIPGICLNTLFDRRTERLRRENAPDIRKFSYYRWMLTDRIPAKDIRMYDLTDSIKSRYDQEKNLYLGAIKKLDRKRVVWILIAEIVRRSGEMAFTVFVLYNAINGVISIGDIGLYIGYALTISNAFQQVFSTLTIGYARANDIMLRLFHFYSIGTEKTECEGRRLESFESLVFEDVYFKYPHTPKYILKGVSFLIKKGDKISIVGINGSGKSTIVKLMLGLYEVEKGRILINGYPLSDYNLKDVRRLFSVLFQNFVPYPITLRENVALSCLEKLLNDADIETSLRLGGIYNDIQQRLYNGLDTYMTRNFDDRGLELSKGQWQRIALARAYFKDAPIIIFDEPSAALDAEAEDKIFNDFASISQEKTAIMISHRVSSARMSNKIIVLDEGKISEQGTHEDLMTMGGFYAKLYRLQCEKYTIKEGGEHE